MPTVLSRQQVDGSGSDPVLIASIFVLILVIVLAVLVILKRQGESEYYEELDEEWDEAANTAFYEAPQSTYPEPEAQKVLPPMPEEQSSVQEVNQGPPLPETGLPDGWSMEQWSHYGDQWLQKNQ